MNAYYHAPEVRFSEASIENLNAVMNAVAKYMNKSVEEEINATATKIAIACAMESPPYVKKSASNSKDAERVGLASAKRDLLRAVTPIDALVDESFKSKSLYKYAKAKDYAKFTQAIEKMPKFSSWKAVPFDPSLHTKARGNNIYRVKEGLRITTLDIAQFRKYMSQIQSRVGYLKAGWFKCVEQLGGKVPVWIRRNLGIAKGEATITKKEDAYQVILNNWTPTVSRYSGRYNYAIDWQAERMMKNLQIRMAYDMKKAAQQGR